MKLRYISCLFLVGVSFLACCCGSSKRMANSSYTESKQRITCQNDFRLLSSKIEGTYIPKDLDEAIDSLDSFIPQEDKRYIADSLSLDDFIGDAHMGVGLWMRNEWCLWSGSRLSHYFNNLNVFHPDDMSGIILAAYYKTKIQGLPFQLNDELKHMNLMKREIMMPFNHIWRERKKEKAHNKREAKKAGLIKGKIVFYECPYGCSTQEEQDSKSYSKGVVTDIDYTNLRIKVKLIESISPYGIIVFDGDLYDFDKDNFSRDFTAFQINSPCRFYMQVGEEYWFDLEKEYWDWDTPE